MLNVNHASKVAINLQTGVTHRQIEELSKQYGENYEFVRVENYPVGNGAGMRAKVVFKHKNADEFSSDDIELGQCFAFSQKQANQVFANRKLQM